MKARIIYPLMILVLMCCGCTMQYTRELTGRVLSDLKLKDGHEISRANRWVMNAKTSVFLSNANLVAPDETSLNAFPRMRYKLFKYLEHALAQQFPLLDSNVADLSVSEALTLANAYKTDILIYPRITRYEDGINTVTEIVEGSRVHTDKPRVTDKTIIQILMFEVHTQRLIDVSTIFSHSHYFANSKTLPSDLFEDAAREYVRRISGFQPG